MKDFLKENVVLVSGIALPLVLVLLFFASTKIGAINTDPPMYKAVYAIDYYSYNNNNPYKFTVDENDHLILRYTPPEEKSGHWSKPALYVFDPTTNHNKKITLPDHDKDQEQTFIIDELQNKKFSDNQESPDGYVFENYYRGNDNLMTEVFGGSSRYRNRSILVKGNNRVIIPKSNQYSNGTFIAWIVE